MARLRTLLLGLAAAAVLGAVLAGPAAASTDTATPAASSAASAPAKAPAASAPGALAARTATFGIQTATAKGIDTRDSFSYEATGGSAVTDYVAITNYTAASLVLHVYATDAYNTASGGYAVLPSTVKPKDLGLWISFGRQFITVPAKTTVIMPFTLRVPAGATPGDHSGGIMVALNTIAFDAKGNQIAIESRVGTRVSLRVPGALRPRVAVHLVSVHYGDPLNPVGTGSATVTYTVSNVGNVRVAGNQAVRITSLVGGAEQSAPIAPIAQLLPGDSMEVTTRVNGILPSFVSTLRITVAPMPVAGDLDPEFDSAELTQTIRTIPWSVIILVLLLAAAAFLLWRRLRRSERDHGSGGKSGTKPPAGPSCGGQVAAKPRPTAPKPGFTAAAPVPVPKAGRAPGPRTTAPVPVPKPGVKTVRR
jgi:hypothetical protein